MVISMQGLNEATLPEFAPKGAGDFQHAVPSPVSLLEPSFIAGRHGGECPFDHTCDHTGMATQMTGKMAKLKGIRGVGKIVPPSPPELLRSDHRDSRMTAI
jgi:hypothetical protein